MVFDHEAFSPPDDTIPPTLYPPVPVAGSPPIPPATVLYKALTGLGSSPLRYTRWPAVGQWTSPPVAVPQACVRGWHLTTAAGLVVWGQRQVYTADWAGPYAVRDTGIRWKVACCTARLVAPAPAWNLHTWEHLAQRICLAISADESAGQIQYAWGGHSLLGAVIAWIDTYAGSSDWDWQDSPWYQGTSTELGAMAQAWHSLRCYLHQAPTDSEGLKAATWYWYWRLMVWLREWPLFQAHSGRTVWGDWLGAIHTAALTDQPLPPAPPVHSWGDPTEGELA